MKHPVSLVAALALSSLVPSSLPAQEAAPKAAEVKPIALADPIAVVEGSEIRKADLDQAFASVLASQGMPADQASRIPEAQRLQFYRMLLDDMIADRLIAKRAGETPVTDEALAAEIARVQKNFGSEEDMKKQLETSGQTFDKVKENLRTQLRQRQWLDAQIKGQDTVTDAEAEEFYKANPEKFQRPEQVRASHILLTVEADAKPETVTEKSQAAQAILDRVKKGEDFAALAGELSEDPSAKQNKGDLDFFSRDQMVKEFADAAFGMKKDEVGKAPVRSQFGFHIIKVTDRREAETIALDKAKPQVAAFLQRQKKQKAVQDFVAALREKADVKVHLPAPAPAPAEADAAAPAPGK